MKNAYEQSRREFMGRLAATSIAVSLGHTGWAYANSAATRTRKDIATLAENSPEIIALRAGVAKMKTREPNDATSWTFQANIHGMLGMPANPLWAQCQHGQWWFLPWHRMYLFYFEQILIGAIQQAGVNLPADFGLPYWNYSDTDGARVIPQVFRDRNYTDPSGQSVTNPLFDGSRRSDLNAEQNPTPLDPDTVDTSMALGLAGFISSQQGNDGFGGQQVATPEHLPDQNHGGLESLPHDQVHDAIGGLMGDPDTAANDPIFWLHHCNIDRLWNRWLNQGGQRSDPALAAWAQQSFTFPVNGGGQTTQTVCKFLNYVPGNLIDYHYDDPMAHDPTGDPGACQGAPPEVASSGHAVGMSAMASAAPATTNLATFPPQLTLSAKPATFTLPVPTEHHATMANLADASPGAAGELALQVVGIDPKSLDGGYYDVYVNLRPGEQPNRKSSAFLGSISSFAMKGRARHVPAGQELSKVFSLTKILKKLQADQRWKNSELTITFVPREMPPGDPNATRMAFHRLTLAKTNHP
jgi:tyrosinase